MEVQVSMTCESMHVAAIVWRGALHLFSNFLIFPQAMFCYVMIFHRPCELEKRVARPIEPELSSANHSALKGCSVTAVEVD